MDEIIVQEVSRRNALTVIQVLNEQNKKIEEQQKRIGLLNEAVSTLTNRLTQLESMLMMEKVKQTGHGASVK